MTPKPDHTLSAATERVRVRDAGEKWGCAFSRCLGKARIIVVAKDGSQWGACSKHIKEVTRAADA